jgi:hypothetical protein
MGESLTLEASVLTIVKRETEAPVGWRGRIP